MRQHFRNICRKIVRITLSKHVVMPRKRNADEISGKREGKDLPSLVPRPYEGEERAWYTLLAHAPGAPEKCEAPDTIVYLVYDAYPVYALR